ncbi:MAG: class A beta-lactamase-related serine hydrolase [Lachnospiraceae bacterium]|nr:class A beta-lactamase-related serine hydrolase [Lachnospiraceae bacterium]
MHPKLTLEKRIQAEIFGYDGKMSVYVNDLRGNEVALDADQPFETASTIKSFILACLFAQIEAGAASPDDILVCDRKYYINGSGLLRSLMETAYDASPIARQESPAKTESSAAVQLPAASEACAAEDGTAHNCISLRAIDVATLMIIISDNIATNMLIDYLGLDTINDYIQSLGYTQTRLHNPIDFDKYDRLGTTTPREYGDLFVRLAKGELVSAEASRQMREIFKKQHYNSTLTRYFPQYYLDCEETEDEELIYVASKSGSMNACRNDGGIVHTPYGDYVIVIMNREFHDILEHYEHAGQVYGAKVSRMILDQYLALEGRLVL